MKRKITFIEVFIVIILIVVVVKGYDYWNKIEKTSEEVPEVTEEVKKGRSEIMPVLPEMVLIDHIEPNFYISKYEITNAEYVRFLNAQEKIDKKWIDIDTGDPGDDIFNGLYGDINLPSSIKVKNGYKNHPVVYVSWYGAKLYCGWLNDKENLSKTFKDKGYRLATENEWNYAYRASKGCSDYYWLDKPAEDYAWFEDNSDGMHQEVGRKKPNSIGIYDLSGNVQEWCSDKFVQDKKEGHGIKGGGFSEPLYFYGSTTHLSWRSMSGFFNDYKSQDTGFRLCRSYIPAESN